MITDCYTDYMMNSEVVELKPVIALFMSKIQNANYMQPDN